MATYKKAVKELNELNKRVNEIIDEYDKAKFYFTSALFYERFSKVVKAAAPFLKESEENDFIFRVGVIVGKMLAIARISKNSVRRSKK